MMDEITTFESWQWEMDKLVRNLVGKFSVDCFDRFTDANGSILKRQQERWHEQEMPIEIEEAVERTILMMVRLGVFKDEDRIVYFPERPRLLNGEPDPINARTCAGFYEVTNHGETAAAYFAVYYHSVSEVITDLLERIKSNEVSGKWGSDYAIWRDGRIMAVIHEPMVGTKLKVVRFTEKRNDPGALPSRFLPGWPTHEQWIESGRGPLWIDYDNPENPAR